MNIWIDVDACPKPIKDILYRVANWKAINVVLITNQRLYHPPRLISKACKLKKDLMLQTI
ncbi:hypothetical protein [Gilliamella sp. Pas-s25]|uniref:hypothetical protein n=1 Tax=Gilliamella sp. Pas-s25 TaxID=2687310 RepID=UPI00135EA8D0|nr:hypothetical protein [Gilliamella sp. Pas-s25]MWP61787.1 hypothetical protein [Gilliamella sp. Pas-s25]